MIPRYNRDAKDEAGRLAERLSGSKARQLQRKTDAVRQQNGGSNPSPSTNTIRGAYLKNHQWREGVTIESWADEFSLP